jgi:hypothetical protein
VSMMQACRSTAPGFAASLAHSVAPLSLLNVAQSMSLPASMLQQGAQ